MKNRVALVTGAGRGIGREIAKGLAAAGARVAISARTLSELETLADELRSQGQEVLPVVQDLAERRAASHLDDRIRRHWGPVDILVNNAGVGSSPNPKPFVEFDDDFWDLTLTLNVTAPYLLTKQLLPPMIERRWGRVINIASINAHIPSLHGAAYTASKHALAGLTKVVAREAIEFGITCNAVCPGVTRSRMNDKRLEYDAKRTGKSIEELMSAASPLGRRIEPEEVASLVVFLAGEQASGINGQLLNVCGGTVMG